MVAIQRGLNTLEKWTNRNLMKFNKTKCKMLQLGWSNYMQQHRLIADQLWSSFAEKTCVSWCTG